jgi:hypothetical protein
MDFASSTVFSNDFNGVVDGISTIVVVGTTVLTSARGTALNGIKCNAPYFHLR